MQEVVALYSLGTCPSNANALLQPNFVDMKHFHDLSKYGFIFLSFLLAKSNNRLISDWHTGPFLIRAL